MTDQPTSSQTQFQDKKIPVDGLAAGGIKLVACELWHTCQEQFLSNLACTIASFVAFNVYTTLVSPYPTRVQGGHKLVVESAQCEQLLIFHTSSTWQYVYYNLQTEICYKFCRL